LYEAGYGTDLASYADRQIPSILSYVEGEELQGAQAKAQLVRNPKNTVAYFRDFLGKEYVQEPPRKQEDADASAAAPTAAVWTPCCFELPAA